MTGVTARADRPGYAGAMQVNGLGSAFNYAREGLDKASRETARVAQDVAENGIEDLDRNIVSLTLAKNAFKANAVVLRTADELANDLLDILA